MILSAMIIIGLLGALAAYAVPRLSRYIALATAAGLTLATILLARAFGGAGFQFTEQYRIVQIGKSAITYHLGVDGISLPLVILTALLGVVAVLVSWREIHTREPAFYALLLLLVTAVIGVFSSLDLVLFFVWWEVVLVATFMLILLWGGENRRYAGMKFLLYTGLGSAALLLAVIILAAYGSADLSALAVPGNVQLLVLGLVLFACFVKMPIVPFHTWLPDAHVQAPTAGSIMLAGVLLKMGAYALLRFSMAMSLTETVRLFLFIMGTVTILYGAWVCLVQRNLKVLIAYSSINHMGFVLVGIGVGTSLGLTGAVFEMVSHGLLAALLFALAGAIHQQTGTFDLDSLHGLVRRMPRVAWLLAIGALGALGLPGMTGFIAEFLIFMAAMEAFGWIALIPLAGMILAGGYFLRLLAKAVFGRNDRLQASEQQVSIVPFALLLAVTFILGILPFLLLDIIRSVLG